MANGGRGGKQRKTKNACGRRGTADRTSLGSHGVATTRARRKGGRAGWGGGGKHDPPAHKGGVGVPDEEGPHLEGERSQGERGGGGVREEEIIQVVPAQFGWFAYGREG